MLWRLQKTQEYWWYVEDFCKRPERKEFVQTPERIAQFRFKPENLLIVPYCDAGTVGRP